MPSTLYLSGFFILFVWIGFLTFYIFKTIKKYSVFTEGVNKKKLEDVLVNILKEQKLTKKDIAFLSNRCDNIEKNGLLHIQKIGLLRFNPFKDTGGDQSFILSLIDAHDTGVVITALYSRSGTRWYAKKVVEGKGYEHELSADEKESLKSAKTHE